MIPTRMVFRVCIWAILLMGNTATEVQMTAYVGGQVLLPCPCTNKTVQVAWQHGTQIVNQYNEEELDNTLPAESYKGRSLLFLSNEKGNCSLKLFDISLSDQKTYTCFTFSRSSALNQYNVFLTVLNKATDVPLTQTPESETSPLPPEKIHAAVSVGVPLSLLVLVILAGGFIWVLLTRRRQRRIQRTIVVDPQAGLPIMKQSPV
ncbi:uncharacterized protein si:dkey-192g7.3 isoform X2 [Hoplias malabaricus]|uniref:uncharacterized protein si:dkey-192g7.3 isoform X2 n=1 Tax=Hoplias malabaricus TaxID=27720 RepID=UPI003461A8F5